MSKRILTPEQKAAKLERQRKWRAENPDKVKAAAGRAYAKKKDDPEFKAKNQARVLAWQKANAEHVNQKNKAWRLANHETELEKERQYRETNREKLREYSRLRQRTLSGVANPAAELKVGKCENPGCSYEGPLAWAHCHGSREFRRSEEHTSELQSRG